MDEFLPIGYEWDNQIYLGKETGNLTKLVWPAFLVEESDIPEPGLKFEIDRNELMRRIPNWGIRRQEDRRLVAHASAVTIPVDLNRPTLPEQGWRFAMQALGSAQRPNCLCLLSANVDPDFRNLSFSRHLLRQGKKITGQLGFKDLIGPVRPVLKSSFPELSFDEFVALQDEKGEAIDSWIRVHERLGAERLNVCHESVLIRASLSKWASWTGISFQKSGSYEIPGGLAPLNIDVENDLGIYIEPNIWMRYRI